MVFLSFLNKDYVFSSELFISLIFLIYLCSVFFSLVGLFLLHLSGLSLEQDNRTARHGFSVL
jgi:hypothetical protein